jgi:hypothetical protein
VCRAQKRKRERHKEKMSPCVEKMSTSESVYVFCVLSQCVLKKTLSSLYRACSLSLSLIFLPTYLLLRVACDGFLVVVFCVGVLVFVFVVLVFDALSSSQIHYKAFFTAATVSASNALISDNMASTLAALASCMTAETILSPLEST